MHEENRNSIIRPDLGSYLMNWRFIKSRLQWPSVVNKEIEVKNAVKERLLSLIVTGGVLATL